MRGKARSVLGNSWNTVHVDSTLIANLALKTCVTTFHSLLHDISAISPYWKLFRVMCTQGFRVITRLLLSLIPLTEVYYAGTSEGESQTSPDPALQPLMEILIQLLTSSLPHLLLTRNVAFISVIDWCHCFPLSAQRRWTLTISLSSMRAPRGAWGCGITPWSWHPPVRKTTSAGSGWPGGACSTWAPRCAWA